MKDMVIRNSLGIFEAALRGFVSKGGRDMELGVGMGVEGDIEGILGSVEEEMRDGAVYRYWLHCVVGKKVGL